MRLAASNQPYLFDRGVNVGVVKADFFSESLSMEAGDHHGWVPKLKGEIRRQPEKVAADKIVEELLQQIFLAIETRRVEWSLPVLPRLGSGRRFESVKDILSSSIRATTMSTFRYLRGVA